LTKTRIIRNVLAGMVALLVCLVVVSLVAVHTSAFRDFLRGEIVRQVQENAGARLEIGSIEMHWSHLGLDLGRIAVYGDQDRAGGPEQPPPLLQAAHFEVGLRFLPLLHGRVELRELILDRPVVHLRIDSNGNSNLPKIPQTGSHHRVDTLFNLEVRDCAIHSGVIFYNDAQIPLDADLHDLKFDARYSALTSQYSGALSYDKARLAARQYEPIDHAMRMEFTANRNELSIQPLLLTTGASRLSLKAQIRNYQKPEITATYQGAIDTGEVAQILRETSVPAGNVALSGNLSYDASDERPFLQALSLQGEATSGRLEFRTGQQPIEVTSLRAAYELKNADLQVTDVAAYLLGGSARGRWEMQSINAPVSVKRLNASLQGVSLTRASQALAPAKVRRLPFLGAADLEVRASWSSSIKNATAHARLAVSSRQQGISGQAIPVNGLVQADYNGPGDTIALGQSYLETANTKLTISGTLSSQRHRDSALNLVATTSDLGEVELLATMAQAVLEPAQPERAMPQLAGRATLSAHVTGRATNPRVQAAFTAQDLAVDLSHWRSLAVQVSADSHGANIQNGALIGMGAQQVNFSGRAGLTNWSLAPSSPIAAQATLANISLATIEQFADRDDPVTGTISGKLSLQGTRTAPDGQVTITLGKASAWNETIDSMRIDAESRQGAIQAKLQLQIPAGAVSADANYTLASEQYDLKLSGNNLNLAKVDALQKRGTVQGLATLSVTGSGTARNPQLAMNLTIPQLNTQGQTISDIAAQVNVANQHARFQLQSSMDQGSVQAKGDVALAGNRYATAALDVRALPVRAVVANFIRSQSSKLAGQTEIHLTVSGPLKSPAQMEAHLQIPSLNVTYGKAQMALARPLEADYRDGTLTVNPSQIRGTGTNLTFGGTIPIKSQAAYSLVADGSMDLSVLGQFARGVRSSGEMEIHIGSQGRSSLPNMHGEFQIKNAVLTTETLPVGIEGLNAQIDVSGDRLDIAKFSGAVGGGNISASGSARLGRQTSFDVALRAQSVRIRYPQGLRSILSGQVNLQGTPADSALTGRVLVDSLSFTEQFDLASLAGYFSENSAGGTPSAFEQHMKLRVAVESAQNLTLASSKLSIGGSANLNLTGTLADPVILGRIGLSSGEVFFLGKRFEVQSGTIEFANPSRTDPVVRLQVTTTIEQYKLTLNLEGPVDRLRTNYTSEPALAPADIIHLLAFGNTNEEASSEPSQSAAMGAESVLAQGVSGQVAGKLETLTGISQLTIDPLAPNSVGDPGAQIAIQERVTGSLLFTFSTNVTDTQSETVEVQYDLNKKTSVTVLRDQNGGYGVDLRLHKEF
jgi:translocation and assembly module TamB